MLFQMDPQEMQWHSEAWSHLHVYTMCGTDQTSIWQTNDSHSRKREVWGSAILPLLRGQLILRWRLWTRIDHKIPGRMGQIQGVPAHHCLLFIPSTPEEDFYNSCGRSAMLHASEIGPKYHLICITCNAMPGLWSTGCAVSPPMTKLARKISWRGCSSTI